MFPNLFQATTEYWRKLDELELAYQQGKISLEEVDVRVAYLIAELAIERRATFTYFYRICQHWLTTQRRTVISLVLLGLLTYIWVLSNLYS
ncbi:MAG: hypothetical protein HRU34_12600 [Richelia sp.]|nr:hypothetical protein [Richelia sp.]